MTSNLKLIKVLSHLIIQANYDAVKKIFLKQNAHSEEIREYFEHFKELKKRNKIKEKKERNIDYWGKKKFTEFKDFVDKLKETKTKTEQKKLKKMEGAELVDETSDYYIYHITNHEAAKTYGSGTKWCITQEDSHYWDRYSSRNNFYFFIAKNKTKEDPLYKVAMTVDRHGDKIMWDALDRQINESPTYTNYKFELKKVNISLNGILKRLEEEYNTLDDYYNSVNAYIDLGEYLKVDYKNPGQGLTDNAKKLVEELKTYIDIDNKEEFSRILIDECSNLSLENIYTTTNEIASMQLGTNEPSVDDQIQEDIEYLTESEKKELHRLAEFEGVYISDDFDSYHDVGDYYNRLVAILDEDKLEKVLEDLRQEKENEENEE